MSTYASIRLNGRHQFYRELLGVLASILLALIVTRFFAHTPWPMGDDYRFHSSIWAETANRIRHLDIPRWNAEAAFGLGEPTYLFYPPLSIYLGGLLTLLCGGYWAAPIFCGIVMVLAAISMRLSASIWLEPSRSWVVSLLYCANPYLLLCCWVRSSYAEMLAAALFPLLIYFTSIKPSTYRVVGCAFMFALVWLSNLPSAVIVSYAIAFYIAVKYLADRDGRYALLSFGGLGLGFGIAAFQVLPSALEMHLVQTDVAVHGFELSNSFVLSGAGKARAVVFAFFSCLFLVGLARFAKRRGSWPIVLLGLFSGLMALRYSSALWKVLPLLANVQFPYRWLFVLGFASLLLAGQIIPVDYGLRRGGWLVICAFCVALVQCGVIAYLTTSGKYSRSHPYNEESTDIHHVVWEYLPKAANPELISDAAKDPTLARADEPTADISILRWDPERRDLNITSDKSTLVTLRLLNYLGWIANINGQDSRIGTEPGTGRAILRIDPGNNIIRLRFSRSSDRSAGLVVTFVALALGGAITWGTSLERRRESDG